MIFDLLGRKKSYKFYYLNQIYFAINWNFIFIPKCN